jgi:hypothetical protein
VTYARRRHLPGNHLPTEKGRTQTEARPSDSQTVPRQRQAARDRVIAGRHPSRKRIQVSRSPPTRGRRRLQASRSRSSDPLHRRPGSSNPASAGNTARNDRPRYNPAHHGVYSLRQPGEATLARGPGKALAASPSSPARVRTSSNRCCEAVADYGKATHAQIVAFPQSRQTDRRRPSVPIPGPA